MAGEHDEGGVMSWAAGVVGAIYDAALTGRTGEAFHQGVNELGAALIACPNTIHQDAAYLPSPSEIGMEGMPTGSVYGEAQAVEPSLPSPSEIANATQAYTPDQGQSQDQGRSM